MADLPPTGGEGWIAALLSDWPLLAFVIGHLVRTETVRALLKREVAAIQERQREDREDARRQRSEDMDRLEKRLTEIGDDVKTLGNDVKALLRSGK